jgi:RNA polymerase sigma-70 factor (ECF subfamily)
MTDDEFAQQVTAMTQTLYRICYAQLSQPCDREDAVQETLRKCWQKRGQLRDARYLQTWVIRVLINECHNIQRRQARLRPTDEVPERVNLHQPMGSTRLHDALLSLDEKLRIPLVLHYMEGYPVSDVASALRIPQGTVKTRLRRGREELKKMLMQSIGGVTHEVVG